MYLLKDQPMRFSEIKRKLPECSVKVLSEALDNMERDGLVIRKQYEGIPVKVTYELTDDMKLMVENMDEHVQLLARFFYKNRDKHYIPPHILDLLEKVITLKWPTHLSNFFYTLSLSSFKNAVHLCPPALDWLYTYVYNYYRT